MYEIWKKRRASYQQMLLKYLRYVFNDHFVIALLFLFGAFSFSYSNFLKTLSPSQELWWAKPLVVVLLFSALHANRVATFLKPADTVFLLAREQDMHKYINNARSYSTLVVLIIQAIICILLAPFLLIAVHLSILNCLFLILTQLTLAFLQVQLEVSSLYLPEDRTLLSRFLLSWLPEIILLAGGLYFSGIFSWVLGIAVLVFFVKVKRKKTGASLLDWRYAVEKEDERLSRLYRFFNMFTDVAAVSPRPKRRRFLDFLLPKYDQSAQGFFTYLYWRGFVRSGEYSNLYLRLTVLGFIILFFIKNYWLALLFAALFIYLIGFQLLPLFVSYDEVVFMHTLPINIRKKFISFSKVLFSLLLFSVIFFFVPLAIHGFGVAKALLALILLVVESWLIARIYSKIRLNKIA